MLPSDCAGAQIVVASSNTRHASIAMGEARPGVPLSASTIVGWGCASKPLLALAVGILRDRGAVAFDTPVVAVLPDELRSPMPTQLTIEHLLRHRVRFKSDPPARLIAADASWASVRSVLQDVELVDLLPLSAPIAGYSRWVSWTILGAVVEALDGRTPAAFVRDEVLEPLGMRQARIEWDEIPEDAAGEVAGDGVWLHGGAADPRHASADVALGGSGPMEDLAHFYQWLLRATDGTSEGPRIISRSTLQHLCAAPPRPQGTDGTWATVRWTRGLCADERVFGSECSKAILGHWSERCVAFADQERDLAVAIALLKPRGVSPTDRQTTVAIVDAIYANLDLITDGTQDASEWLTRAFSVDAAARLAAHHGS